MNKLKTTKYMNMCTTIGYFLGFGLIIYYSFLGGGWALPVIGVIVIFLGRSIGYAIDRTIEAKEEIKK